MRVAGGVKLFQRPFVVRGALAHERFRFEMEHRCLCVFWFIDKVSWRRRCHVMIILKTGLTRSKKIGTDGSMDYLKMKALVKLHG